MIVLRGTPVTLGIQVSIMFENNKYHCRELIQLAIMNGAILTPLLPLLFLPLEVPSDQENSRLSFPGTFLFQKTHNMQNKIVFLHSG